MRGGRIAYRLKVVSQAAEVFGIDCNDDFVREANQLGVRAIRFDVEAGALPFEDNGFDGIFCGELIEHLKDTDHLLEEIFRILDPSGFAVITTPNLAAWYNRIALILGFQPFWTDTGYKYSAGKMIQFGESGGPHIRVFTLRALVQSLVLHGFDVVETRGAYLPLPRRGFITTLYNIVGDLTSVITSLSGDLIAVVRKKP
jgi:SAM-dependent methyltransferase